MSRLWICFLLLILPAPAWAAASDWVRDDAVAARIVSASDTVGDSDSVSLGLDLHLNNEWHTYWRSPGDAGLPPQLDWSRSQDDHGNVKAAILSYPAPHRYSAYGLETVGYKNHVIFPIDVTLLHKGQPLNAAVSIDVLVCSSICVPKHFDLSLTLPTGIAKPSPEADLVQHAHDHLPATPDGAGILLKSINNDGHNLSFSITARDALSSPDIFVEDDKNIGFGAPTITPDPDGHAAILTVKPIDTLPQNVALAGMPVTLTIVDDQHATEIKTTIPSINAAAPTIAKAEQPAFRLALLLALIGGLILNLMPCVLPVLSLKILGVVSHGGSEKKRVRQSFLFTAAGIIFSFLLLAAVMVVLRYLGMSLGWGVQFQQPLFLMSLVLLLTFFAANMWGLFEITLPRFLVDNIDTSYHPKLAGDFATGAFATLLATPCSAPFLGTAVGFALASGTAEIFSIFAALGIGMALPYLAVALFPRTATLLPKPGAWMLRLKIVLGLALALTASWLIWVMAAQITVDYAILFGLLMLGIIVLLALKKYGVKRPLITFGIIEFCLAALLFGSNGAMKPKSLPETNRLWLAYNEPALHADIAEGKTVFLDITADWCLTCKANMKYALADSAVSQRLFHTDIIAMQADWTNPDPIITDILHRYGRYGIPFNAVYGPGAPDGIILPELLTPALVLDALDKAQKDPTQP